MKKLNKYLRILTMIVFLFAVFLHATGQENKGTIKVTNNSCGAEVLQYLKNNYYNTPPCNYTLPQKKELSLAEMLTACKTFKTEAQAVKCQLKDLKALAKPIILHLKTNHYILLLGNEDNQFEIYDPAAEHLKKVGQSYMEYFFSNQAIVFSDKHNCKFISKYELINSSGTYAHEYPPPNESDDFYLGLMKYLKPKGECSINRSKGGSPLMSFNPLNLNIVVEDMPMWYDPGIGPFIQLGLVYNSNDQQQISGGLLVPTQYFPFGKRWSFYYASFYHEQSPDIITLIMTDGAKVTFTFSENTSIPNHGNFHNKFERYPVTGGYGYCLTMKKSKMKFIYDNPIHDKLTSIVDQNGNVVVLNYNTDFNLVSITDANGRPLNFTLNDDGRIIQATDPLGRTATFEYGYTNDEFLVGITDMGGFESTIEYDEVPILAQLGSVIESQITSITTPTGTSEIAYAPTNNIGPWLLAFTWIFTNPAGVSSIAQYSWGGYFDGITKVYDNNGNFTEYFSNLQKSQFTHIVPPDPSATVYYRYDEQGKIINITNGIFETKYIYDDNGNIIQVIDPRNKITDLSYDLNDNLKAITDPMNRTISFDYDQNNNPVSITTSVNQQFFSYYSDGNLKDVTDANGNVTSMEYDAMGYLIQIDFPISSPYSYINDDVGRTTSVTINGVTYQYTYDYLDQTTQVSFPDATQVNMTYDFRNLVGITDRAGRHTSLAYDKMNQVIGVKNPLGLISLNRDPNGNVQILTINEQANYFVYDKMDRLITETNPDLSSKYYTYNELGNVFTRIDEKGLLTTYSYDYNLLVNIDYPDNTADVSFAYNDNGEIIEMTDGIGTKNYEYDSFGRLIGVSTTGGAGNFNYTLDSVGNRKTMVTDGLAVFYTYDKLNRLKHIESNHASADYLYDVNNNMSKITYGNGTYTEYAYNELNLPVSLYHKKSNNEIFSGFNYTYDQASLIKKIEDQQGNTSNYTYDYAYQLIEEQVLDNAGKTMWHNKFEYDNMGNRLTINANGTTDLYTYNSSNQL
nr:hypothetical protein [Bacteroidota bacterium]